MHRAHRIPARARPLAVVARYFPLCATPFLSTSVPKCAILSVRVLGPLLADRGGLRVRCSLSLRTGCSRASVMRQKYRTGVCEQSADYPLNVGAPGATRPPLSAASAAQCGTVAAARGRFEDPSVPLCAAPWIRARMRPLSLRTLFSSLAIATAVVPTRPDVRRRTRYSPCSTGSPETRHP